MRTSNLLAGTAIALGLAGIMTGAHATVFTVDAWTGLCASNCVSTDATEQGLPAPGGVTQPLITGGTHELIGVTATTTGDLLLDVRAAGPNTYTNFFSNSGGLGDPSVANPAPAGAGPTITLGAAGSVVLSTGTYGGTAHAQTSTLMRFTFTLPAGSNALTFLNDDGVSLFATGVTATASDLLPVVDSQPEHSTKETVTLGPGTYDLWYAEVNGAPSQLDFSFVNTPPPPTIPEPASLALFGTGLIALGLLRRRRKAT